MGLRRPVGEGVLSCAIVVGPRACPITSTGLEPAPALGRNPPRPQTTRMRGEMLFWLFLTGLGAGIVGALLGIGGGIVLVPILHLGLGLPMPSAVAVSLACVIATSTGAAATFAREGLCDVRLGMRLELATVAGAIGAAFFAPYLPAALVRTLFGLAILPAVRGLLLQRKATVAVGSGTAAGYGPRNYGIGMGASLVAGSLSGVLGIGGGFIKVPVMNLAMGVPMRVATATSNFMIGITAAASAFVYLARGQLDLSAAAPAILGVLAGAPLGARLLPRVPADALRKVFGVLLALLATQMIVSGLGLSLPGGSR